MNWSSGMARGLLEIVVRDDDPDKSRPEFASCICCNPVHK